VKYDGMVDQLSMAKASRMLNTLQTTPVWSLYCHGRAAQVANERRLANMLLAQGDGREAVLASWMQSNAW
jgi:hypothetical protein